MIKLEACFDKEPRSSVNMGPLKVPTTCMASPMTASMSGFAAGDTLTAFDPASGRMLRVGGLSILIRARRAFAQLSKRSEALEKQLGRS